MQKIILLSHLRYADCGYRYGNVCIGVIAGGEVVVITILMVILLGPAVDLVGRIMKTGRGVEKQGV